MKVTIIIFKEKLGTDDLAPSQAFKLINATARQRCEAAYLTFNDPN